MKASHSLGGDCHESTICPYGSLVNARSATSTFEAIVSSTELSGGETLRPHPLGVKPSGNQYAASSNARHAIGILQSLPDELLVSILEFLDGRALRKLGASCRALFAFCSSDELWKGLFMRDVGKIPVWRSSWRSTYLGLQGSLIPQISCHDLFSDVLYRPYLCAQTSLLPYTQNIPTQNLIPRLENLSSSEFSEQWCEKPFILTKPILEWPVYDDWDTSSLLRQYKDVVFRAESVDWPLSTYVDYMENTSDESPLYLFDRGFVEKMSLQVGRDQEAPSYWIPDCFGEDFFSVLGDLRPDSRWLIVGPARSGSTFHKDPNATSAWNAVLRGAKYWIMFPPTTTSPPGVFMSEDQSEVTSPLSIAEWLLGFHAEARMVPGCQEGICRQGEVLHVPSGWWHLVVNLDASIAITHNFVPKSHLPAVLVFLKDRAAQASGFKQAVENPYAIFVERMQHEHAELLRSALADVEKHVSSKKRKWDVAVGDKQGDNGFSFGFGQDDSDEEVP